jgi:hypothetical protein
VVWLKRPMPPDQWPTDGKPFRWWIRSSCPHAGKQWAFYEEADADTYETIFRENPCYWTRCGHDRKRI